MGAGLTTLNVKSNQLAFPGGSVVKNLPANAGDTGLTPDPVRSHMPWSNKAPGHNYWSPRALEPKLCNKRSHGNKKPAHRN